MRQELQGPREDPRREFDEERFEWYWRDEGKLREQLTAAVEALIRSPPPRNPSWLRRVRRRQVERRHVRQKERTPVEQPVQTDVGEDR